MSAPVLSRQPLTVKIIAFLTAHPASTDMQIAEGIDRDTLTVRCSISNNNTRHPGMINALKRDDGTEVYVLNDALIPNKFRTQVRKEPEQIRGHVESFAPNTLSEAICNILRETVRQQVNAALDMVIQSEVDAALSTVQSRIQSRIFGNTEPIPTEVERKRIYTGTYPAKPVIEQQPVAAVMPPPGPAFTPNDIVSKRTAHKDVGRPVQMELTPASNEPKAKTKVTIVGLHTNKQELIRKEFKDCFDLRMFNPDERRRLQTSVQIGDVVLMLADFVSHEHINIAEKAGAEITIVKHGMSSLRDELTRLYVGRSEAA